MVGPGQLARLPALLEAVSADRRPRLEVGRGLSQFFGGHSAAGSKGLPPARSWPTSIRRSPALREVPHQAMVRIMFGCNKGCSYCIVPRVRGREQNRPAAEILDEVRRLVDRGCVEVTLLGQTVNSYRDESGGRTLRLADLLQRLDGVAGLRRLKFVTNHPRHMTTELLQAVRNLPKVSPYLHVPAQSGTTACWSGCVAATRWRATGK